MASVYKKRSRADGKLLPEWRFKYRDRFGVWRYGVGWTDKNKTLNHARDLEAEHRAVRKGEKEAPSSWMKQRNKPIQEVIDEYLSWGRTQGGRGGRPWDSQNASLKEKALHKWVADLGLTLLSDLDLQRVEKCIQKQLSGKAAPKSVALRVEALQSLCNWAVLRGMLIRNPLKGMAKLDTRPKVPHRSLTDVEVAKLLKAAPVHRGLWYRTCLETGFRVNEARMLRVSDLDQFGPSLFLAADFSKDRKEHRQPITRDLADQLAKLTVGRAATDRLLRIPGSKAAGHIAKDYEKAEIADVTPDGKATWHSLRKVYVNNLVKSGQDLKTVMTLARHSSAQLSMETYAKADPVLLRSAAQAVADKLKTAVANSESCSVVAPKVVGEEAELVSVGAEEGCGENKWWAILDSNQ